MKFYRIQPIRFLYHYFLLFISIARGGNDARQIFHILLALNGRQLLKLCERLKRTPEGATLFERRPCLTERLTDVEGLQSFSEGTLGHELWRFQVELFRTRDLVNASFEAFAHGLDSDEERYIAHRLRDLHDVWHVVTGYGCDRPGENALMAFAYAQTRLKSTLFWLLHGMAQRVLFILVRHENPDGFRMAFEGWRRGCAARDCITADWEQLLFLPLAEARRALRVTAARRWRPMVRPPAWNFSDGRPQRQRSALPSAAGTGPRGRP